MLPAVRPGLEDLLLHAALLQALVLLSWRGTSRLQDPPHALGRRDAVWGGEMVPEVGVCRPAGVSPQAGRVLGRVGQLELLLQDVWRGSEEVGEGVLQPAAQ